jgi:hypothetical protein
MWINGIWMGVRRVGVERCKQEGIIKYTAVGFWEYTFGMGGDTMHLGLELRWSDEMKEHGGAMDICA